MGTISQGYNNVFFLNCVMLAYIWKMEKQFVHTPEEFYDNNLAKYLSISKIKF